MKAIRLHEPAGISGLRYEEVPDAKPMACDVLVKVAACGITHNELDYPIWTCRAGHQRLTRPPAAGGTLVSVRAAAPPPATRGDITTVIFIQESSRAQLAELARLVDQGHLRPQVGAVYPLARAAEAFSAKAAGGIPGRVVLQP